MSVTHQASRNCRKAFGARCRDVVPGFTLIEILVAVTASGMILVAASALLATGSKAVSRADLNEEELTLSVFLDMLSDELRSAVPKASSASGLEGSRDRMAFRTTRDSYVSGTPVLRSNAIEYRVKARTGESELVRAEITRDGKKSAEYVILRAAEITFSYIDPSGRRTASWTQDSLPVAVRMSVKTFRGRAATRCVRVSVRD